MWSGLLVVSLVYNFGKIVQNKSKKRSIFENVIILKPSKHENKGCKSHIIFIILTLLFLTNETLMLWAFYLAEMARLNLATVTAIQAVIPALMALIEKIVLKKSLKTFHIVGITIFVISALIITFSSGVNLKSDGGTVETWIPVMVTILNSFTLSIEMVLGGYYINQMQFSPLDLSFSRFFIIGMVLGVVCCFYYPMVEFNPAFFGFGLLASACLGISKMMLFLAFQRGPTGPSYAIVGATCILLFAIQQWLKEMKSPNYLEIIAILLCIIGTIVLSIPNMLYSIYAKICRKKKTVEVVQVNSEDPEVKCSDAVENREESSGVNCEIPEEKQEQTYQTN